MHNFVKKQSAVSIMKTRFYEREPNRITLTVLGLLFLSLVVFFALTKNTPSDDVENTGIVSDISYVDYILNARSQTRIKYYRIRIDYSFEGKQYTRTVEVLPKEYKAMFPDNLKKDEVIRIKHPVSKPYNLSLMKH